MPSNNLSQRSMKNAVAMLDVACSCWLLTSHTGVVVGRLGSAVVVEEEEEVVVVDAQEENVKVKLGLRVVLGGGGGLGVGGGSWSSDWRGPT
ncbi:hypothetical protein DHEL01_v204912 [Diaporthe helianthi]|uniref:Uncharacterized protein n=1 Tax=Diaporthe helianthi TaxID=158607 RepID=A0A2P5I2H0_DIAHE|nr:hypothetical protein DHEL01_v204912 [Diaporthe helianthi]